MAYSILLRNRDECIVRTVLETSWLEYSKRRKGLERNISGDFIPILYLLRSRSFSFICFYDEISS